MKFIINAGIFILNLIYSFMKICPVKKKVTFLSRQSNSPSLDISMLNDKIKELHPDYSTVILCKKLEGGLFSKAGYLFHMLRQMYHMATSEVIIIDSYCIAVSLLNHRESLLIIQMWHSIGTMKKFGYSILDKPEGSSSKVATVMRMHKNYDYILAAGDGYKSHLASGFNYPENKIVTLPLPRVERLKDKKYEAEIRSRILSRYPGLSSKKNIVYVPTFRKVNDSTLIMALENLCSNIDYSKYNLIIKVHPLTDLKDFDCGNAVADNEFSSFDMLYISDIVISDYSCIMYEAAVLNKPVYLYTYDYDEYMSTRDIYMDYMTEVPGPICFTAEDLMSAVNNNSYDMEKLKTFLNKYVYTGSRHETEDIVSFIFSHLKNSR